MRPAALLVCFSLLASSAYAPEASAQASARQAASLPDFTALVKKQGPAVVNIITSRKAAPAAGAGGPGGPGSQLDPQDPFYEFFRRFMPDIPRPNPGPGQGIGSGFIISQDGYILTNAHVVAGSSEVTVRMADAKREFKAKVVGTDERTDVAALLGGAAQALDGLTEARLDVVRLQTTGFGAPDPHLDEGPPEGWHVVLHLQHVRTAVPEQDGGAAAV